MGKYVRKNLERAYSNYFEGWERFAIKYEDGEIEKCMPDEMAVVGMTLRAGDEILIGPADDVKGYFALHSGLKENELDQHREVGEWRPGRMVIQDSQGRYQVWVRYDKEIFKDKGDQSYQVWAKIDNQSRVIHLDRKNDEQAVKPSRMNEIFAKLSKYFCQYELGVYQEATETQKGKVWGVGPTDKTIAYLKAMNAQGRHIFIRPTFDHEDHFMLHDDVNRENLHRHHTENDGSGRWKPGRMVVESSPGNFQVWIKSSRSLSVEEKKHWLALMQSDPGAAPRHRWGRCPGFRNRKEKYATDQGYPLARLVWVDWQNQAQVPKAEIRQPTHGTQPLSQSTPPRKYSDALPTRDQYYKGVDQKGKAKESEQDFAYALALLRRGVPKDEIERRILNERTDWSNHLGETRIRRYLETTLANAEKALENSTYTITARTTTGTPRQFRKTVMIENRGPVEAESDLRRKAGEFAAQIGEQNMMINVRKANEEPSIKETADRSISIEFR